ncbi:MAG TPA: peptidylprolyl isomerase [Bacillota bacterium]|nr:peptidylprolyl isomerase [Bacillota bacterium]
MLQPNQAKEDNQLTEPNISGNETNPQVLLETSLGNIVLELYPDKAPITVENFLSYVDSGFYNGTIFHRIIPGFMIQGGGMTPGLNEKSTQAPIKNEAANGLSNERGTIAMARTQVVDSATSQFFINVKDNAFLDHRNNTMNGFGYCVFGKVVDGMDVADKIVAKPTKSVNYYDDVPVEDIMIVKAQKVK